MITERFYAVLSIISDLSAIICSENFLSKPPQTFNALSERESFRQIADYDGKIAGFDHGFVVHPDE